METTSNYGLKKPAGSDYYNIEDFNGNADILDAALADKQTAYTALEQIEVTNAMLNTAETVDAVKKVHDALPENSTLTMWTGTYYNNNFAQMMPARLGTCVIRKSRASLWTFVEYLTGTVFQGSYAFINNSKVWSGWKNCSVQQPPMPTRMFRNDMGGIADEGGAESFEALGPVAVTKYDSWARIDFALRLEKIKLGDIEGGNYYMYGIPLATLRSITGLPLTDYQDDDIIPGQTRFLGSAANENGAICGGFSVKWQYLCPGRWYLKETTNEYAFGAWSVNAFQDGDVWQGTIFVGK